MQKYCIYCAELLDEHAVFCHACGKRQPDINKTDATDESSVIPQELSREDSQLQAEATENRPKKPKKKFIVNLVRNSILLLVSIIIFAFSFAPVFNLDFSGYTDKYFNVDLDLSISNSAVDGIIYLFDSAKEYEDSTDSPLYDKLSDLYDDLSEQIVKIEDVDDLSSREKKQLTESIEKLVVLEYRLALQTENTKTNVSHVTIAIISLIYVLITLVCLVFSILNFVCSFGLMKNKQNIFYNISLSLTCAIPALVLITYTAFYAYMGNFSNKVLMGSGALTNFIVSVVTIVTLLTLSYIFDSRKVKVSNIVLRSISALLSILVICMCFTPMFTTSVRTIFEGRDSKSVGKIPVYFSFFESFILNESEVDSISNIQNYTDDEKKAYFSEQFDLFSEYKKNEINKGYADEENRQYLVELITCSAGADIGSAISVIGLLFLLAVTFAGVLLQQNLAYFTGCKYLHILARTSKILTLVFASLAFAASIAVFIGLAICIPVFATSGYSILLGAGLFFMLAFAIAACSIPTRIKTEN